MPAPKIARDRVAALAASIRAYCAENADPVKAQKWARYFKEGYDAWGLLDKEHPLWNERQAEWLNENRDIGIRGFLRLGNILFASGKYEEGALALRFISSMRGELDAGTFPLLGQWFEGIRNWAHADVLCNDVIAPLLKNGVVSLDNVATWRASSLKYQRRAVPVAMLGLLKTDCEVPPLLDFVRPLMTDSERVVHQGVGWFLREAWKKDPEPVEAFLLEWKDQAPRLIYQYATEKMAPADKERFRASKRRG